jgi:GrpB-like predicted nucleotidyltransferase (UPF0157 family)
LRDYLRANPDQVAAYGAAKRALFEAGARTLPVYSEEKTRYLAALLDQARAAAGNAR